MAMISSIWLMRCAAGCLHARQPKRLHAGKHANSKFARFGHGWDRCAEIERRQRHEPRHLSLCLGVLQQGLTVTPHDDLGTEVARRARRVRQWIEAGEPSLLRQWAAVGVLGWLIVVPVLSGIALGRWLDDWANSGLVFTAALMTLGLAAGCWMAWRWMHTS